MISFLNYQQTDSRVMHDNDGLKFYLYEFSLTEIQKNISHTIENKTTYS